MKKVLALMAVIFLLTTNLYAGNGDLIVNGNVGIGGMTGAQRSLHIAATSGETAQIRMGQASTYYLDIGYNNSLEYGFLQAYKSTGYDRLALNPNGGNVGIGTTEPLTNLQIGGGTFAEATNHGKLLITVLMDLKH